MTLNYAAMKSGKGRPTGKARKVRDVETLPCPARPGPHWLTNDRDGNTYCRGCRVPWADLDAQARNADELAPCDGCGIRLVRHRTWRAATTDQRREWAAEDIGPQQAPGQCHGCYQRERRKAAKTA
jgi:hypothetical protein